MNDSSGSSDTSDRRSEVTLSRDLRLMDITLIGVGAMIGAGIFVLTGIAAGTAGPALILSFAINGVITVFTAMVYAELGSAIPEAGGGFHWVKQGLPGPNAFIAGWMSWFAHAVAGSLYALGFGAYIELVLSELQIPVPWIGQDLLQKALAVLIIVAFLYINLRGASETGLAGNIVTILKVVILLVFVGSGLWAIIQHPEYMDKFSDFAPEGMIGIFTAMGLTFVAFEGYEIIVQSGEEVKKPRQNIPRAVFLSLAIVVPLYMLVAFVAIGAVNPGTDVPTYQWLAAQAELGIAEAARQFMPFGTVLLLIGGILSTMSALNATTYSSTRVSFAMGRDRSLPDAFASVHKRRRTPHNALALSGALIMFMAVAVPIEDVAAAADILFLLLFLQVNLAAIIIRKKYGTRLRYGYLMPFFPVVPIVGIITKLGLAIVMFDYSPIAWYVTLGWIAVGAVLYYLYARPRAQEEQEDETPVVRRERPRFDDDEETYRVLVPIANEKSLPVLLPPAIRAAQEQDGSIILLHVITVPSQLPVSAGRRYVEGRRELIGKAMKFVDDAGASAEVMIRVSHRPAQAIAETAEERQVDLLVMGWRGRSRTPSMAVGENIDRIVDEVNCETLIMQQNSAPPYEHILVPVLKPARVASALEKARLVAKDHASVNIVHIFERGSSADERKRYMEKVREQVDEFREERGADGLKVSVEDMQAAHSITAIVSAAKEYDCVILGATRESWLRRKFFRSSTTRIARRIKPPLILVRPKAPVVGFGVYRILNYLGGRFTSSDRSSEKELEDHGMLRPESDGKEERELHTSVNRLPLIFGGVLAIASTVVMYFGSGGVWTWLGGGAFLIGLGVFSWVSIRGTRFVR